MKHNDKKLISRSVENESRRTTLKWTPPLLAAVMLPAHAQMSTCVSQLVMSAVAPSKCSGSPAVGIAVVTINSDAADTSDPTLDIIAINVMGAAASDTIVLPTLPLSVSASVGADIEWTGNASDATTCLPLSSITFDVEYQCAGNPSSITQTFDLTTVLADAIP